MTTPEYDKKIRLDKVVLELVCKMIPFNPPLKGASLERMKENNPKGYALLLEYQELTKEEEK
jgi:hypothetical protein